MIDIVHSSNCINSHLLVEASAGTGKTFTIEHLFVRRLLETSSNGSYFSCRDFLVITFTRACAKELKLRIQSTLDRAIKILENQEIPSNTFEYLENILKAGPKATFQAKRRLIDAKLELDDAIISTIHGFCRQVQEEVALNNGSYLFKKLGSSADIVSICQEFLLYEFDEKQFSTSQLYMLLKGYQQDLNLLMQEVGKKLWVNDRKGSFLSYNEQILRLQKEISKLPYTKEIVLEVLETISHNYCNLRTKTGALKKDVEKCFEAFSNIFLKNASSHDFEQFILHPLFFSEQFQMAKRGTFEQDPFLTIMLDKLESFLLQLAHPDALMSQLIAYLRPFVKKILEKRGLFTYDSLLEDMEEAIQNPLFCQFLEKRFQVVIVDEFQDTSPIQWKVLATAFLNNASWKGYLYLVGDPKQAIYAFREADVYNYMEAKGSLPKQATRTLHQNFRSSQALLEGLNNLWAGPENALLFYMPKIEKSLEMGPLIASSKVADLDVGDGKRAVHFFVAKGSLGKKRNWPTVELEEEIIFPFIAKEIDFLNSKGISLRDCAVLVKDRYQAARFEEYCQNVGLEAISWRMPSVIGSEAHQMLKRLIHAIRYPKDKSALLSLLCLAPFFYSRQSCQKLTIDTEEGLFLWAEEVSKLQKLKKSFYDEGVASLFQLFFETPFYQENLRVKTLEGGQQLLIDLEYLIEIVIEHEDKFQGSMESLAHFLDDLEELNQDEKDSYSKRFEPDQEAVQILTMHRCKGLEFDIVFALGTASRTRIDDPAEIQETDSEKIRQLYVASTRAKRRLYLPLFSDVDEKIIASGTCSSIELYFAYHALWKKEGIKAQGVLSDRKKIYEYMTWPIQQASLDEMGHYASSSEEKPSQFLRAKLQAEKSLPTQKMLMPLFSLTTKISSFSRMKAKEREYETLLSTDLPQGVTTGILLHELLATIVKKRISAHDLVSWTETALQGTALASFHGHVSRMLYNAFHTPFFSNHGTFTLSEVDLTKSFCEMEFFQLQNKESQNQEFLRGTIDLAFEHKGYYFLLDWKSNLLEDYSEESLQKTIFENQYDLQAKLYSDAFLKYLEGFSNEHTMKFGGFFFFFLRGPKAVYLETKASVEVGI